jgi:hypothetical protein
MASDRQSSEGSRQVRNRDQEAHWLEVALVLGLMLALIVLIALAMAQEQPSFQQRGWPPWFPLPWR